MAVYIKDLAPDVPALKKYFEFLNKYEITDVQDIEGFLKVKVDPSFL